MKRSPSGNLYITRPLPHHDRLTPSRINLFNHPAHMGLNRRVIPAQAVFEVAEFCVGINHNEFDVRHLGEDFNVAGVDMLWKKMLKMYRFTG